MHYENSRKVVVFRLNNRPSSGDGGLLTESILPYTLSESIYGSKLNKLLAFVAGCSFLGTLKVLTKLLKFMS